MTCVLCCAQEPERRDHLWGLVQRLGQGLGVKAESPIVPLIVGSEAAALKASAQLLQRGFYVPAIRPPTVAPGTSRQVLAWSLTLTLQCFFRPAICSAQKIV